MKAGFRKSIFVLWLVMLGTTFFFCASSIASADVYRIIGGQYDFNNHRFPIIFDNPERTGYFPESREGLEKTVAKAARQLHERQVEIQLEIEGIRQWLSSKAEGSSRDEWNDQTRKLFKLLVELELRSMEAKELESIVAQYLSIPLLRLVSVPEKGPGGSSSGGTTENGWLYSLKIRELPLEIIPGSPVSYWIEAKQRMRWGGEHNCYNRAEWKQTKENAHWLHATFSGASPLSLTAVGKKQFVPFCDYAPFVEKEGKRTGECIGDRDHPCLSGTVKSRVQAPFELDDVLTMQVRLYPNKFPQDNKYLFRGDVVTSGTMINEKGLDGATALFDASLSDTQGFCVIPAGTSFSCPTLQIDIGPVKLLYKQVSKGEPYITSLPEYHHPEDFNNPPFIGEIKKALTLPNLAGKPSSEAKTWLADNELKPSLRPGSPAPSAALTGAVEKHDPPAGTEVAFGSTVVLTVHSPFVDTRKVPSLLGMKLAAAKDLLKKKGLEHELKPGTPATSAARSGTIETQSPAAGTSIKAGEKVVLEVHSEFVKHSTVPDVTGLTVDEAKKLLSDAKLKPALKPGVKPSTQQQAGTVERQEPPAGTETAPKSEVSIFVYGPYVATVAVPNVLQLSFEDAKQRLGNAGLTITRKDAGKPQSALQANTVQKQDPAAGTKLEKGDKVFVWTYGAHIPTREELIAGHDCSRVPNSYAAWDNAVNKPRCFCKQGYVLNMGRNKCVSVEAANQEVCESKWPGSGTVAVWSANKKVYECGCPNGMEWDLNGRLCITMAEKNRILCQRDRPGTVPGGRSADGTYLCNCPAGQVLNARSGRCEVASGGNGEGCDYDIMMIGQFMNNYRADPSNKLQKQMAEQIAGQALNRGCDQTHISQALGTGGVNQSSCPPGQRMETKPGSWGQETVCVPAGQARASAGGGSISQNRTLPNIQCPPTITLLGRTRPGTPPRGSKHFLVQNRSGVRSGYNEENYFECRYDIGGSPYDAIRMSWVFERGPRLDYFSKNYCNKGDRLPPDKMDGYQGRTGEMYNRNKLVRIYLDWEYTDRNYLINLGSDLMRKVESYAIPCPR